MTLPDGPRDPLTVTIIGGGPTGLIAAEILATAGVHVTVFDHMASVGRKFLLAGRGGLNLTHSEPFDRLLARYGNAAPQLERALMAFPPAALQSWCEALGEPTFVGSSGRVFPESFRATPLLRSWLTRLAELGVTIVPRHRWIGFGNDDAGNTSPLRMRFERRDGAVVDVAGDATIVALGGASWPRVGSDGGWVSTLRSAGVTVNDLRPANSGVRVLWTPLFVDRFAGSPLMNISVTVDDVAVRGGIVVTDTGLEGGPIYAHSTAIRASIDATGSATLRLNLQPDLSAEELGIRLTRRRPKESLSTSLRTLGLSPVSISLLREATGNQIPTDAFELGALITSVPLAIVATSGLERAISSAGGVAFGELDESFMLRRLPGVFVAGEMIDWEAPTGGYLLQACFSTGVAAAHGVLDWLTRSDDHQPDPEVIEVEDGDTIWRFDRRFLGSNWTCIWGRGCQGILSEPAEHLGHGCCSLGAELDGTDDATNLSAVATALTPDIFQHHAAAAELGVFGDENRSNTRVVDGACIFLNRSDFDGGAGCALHLGALAANESPIDWKPSVCWQLPVKVDWEMRADDIEIATVRGWGRRDWGEHGDTMAWVCTENPEAYCGDRPVIESLAEELESIVGETVFVELRRRWS